MGVEINETRREHTVAAVHHLHNGDNSDDGDGEDRDDGRNRSNTDPPL